MDKLTKKYGPLLKIASIAKDLGTSKQVVLTCGHPVTVSRHAKRGRCRQCRGAFTPEVAAAPAPPVEAPALDTDPLRLPEAEQQRLAQAFSRSIAVQFSTSSLGVRRKVASSAVEVRDTEETTDSAMLRVSKVLLECDEYDAI